MHFDGTLTMSRGLGRIERAVMEVFQSKADSVIDSIEVAALIAGRNTVTVSEDSSCRRALRTLARQGKIVDLGRDGHRYHRRWYALPNAAADHRRTGYFGKPLPKPMPVLNAKDIDAIILDMVRGGFRWGDDNVASWYLRHRHLPPHPDEVPYEWLSNEVQKRLRAVYPTTVRSAVSKSVRRLIAQGMIEARGVQLGRNQHTTIRYVRLVGG
jgi:hypothetical protein